MYIQQTRHKRRIGANDHALVPEISVELLSGPVLADGSSVDFGQLNANDSGVQKTFTIRNVGAMTCGMAADADAVIAKEKASWEAWKNKDEAAVRKLCAADYREVMAARLGDLSSSLKSMNRSRYC